MCRKTLMRCQKSSVKLSKNKWDAAKDTQKLDISSLKIVAINK